jgi:hypothetical protein
MTHYSNLYGGNASTERLSDISIFPRHHVIRPHERRRSQLAWNRERLRPVLIWHRASRFPVDEGIRKPFCECPLASTPTQFALVDAPCSKCRSGSHVSLGVLQRQFPDLIDMHLHSLHSGAFSSVSPQGHPCSGFQEVFAASSLHCPAIKPFGHDVGACAGIDPARCMDFCRTANPITESSRPLDSLYTFRYGHTDERIAIRRQRHT